jgi:hypothetical protein
MKIYVCMLRMFSSKRFMGLALIVRLFMFCLFVFNCAGTEAKVSCMLGIELPLS